MPWPKIIEQHALDEPVFRAAESDRIAHELAEQVSREMLEMLGEEKQFFGKIWYAINDPHMTADERDALDLSITYLDLRGLLERSIAFADHVRIREPSEIPS